MDKEREDLIAEKIQEQDIIEMMQLKGIKQIVWQLLLNEKGFKTEDIEIDPEFTIELSNGRVTVSIDFILNLLSLSFMVIRCIPTSIESWERYTIAFARAVKDYQIPYAAVTDGENIRIFDALSGSLISESMNSISDRKEALHFIKNFKPTPCSAKRLEKEKRIIYAFEGIKCPTQNRKK